MKHGIAKRVQGGAIHIAAVRSNGTLTLSVHNDGPTLAINWEKAGSGIGIYNVRTRLQGLYGNKFELSLQNGDEGGVKASLSIPLISAAPKD